MRLPNPWKKVLSILFPARGRSERLQFSLGSRPLKGETPPQPPVDKRPKRPLSKKLDDNLNTLKEIFHVPDSCDIVVREMTMAEPHQRVALMYVEGLASFDKLYHSVLQPILIFSELRKDREKNLLARLKESLLTSGQVSESKDIDDLVKHITMGDAAVLVDGENVALAVETKGWEHRQVEQTLTERIVRGPQTGFTEVIRSNTALIRTMIHNPDLVMENITVGERSPTQVVLAYIRGLANDKIVQELKRRLGSVSVDTVLTSGDLEKLIEDAPSLIPTILSTERPDRVASFLLEGACAILVAGDPFALVCPVTFFAFLHSPEDAYLRWPYGSILRLIRAFSFFVALYFLGVYVAIVLYHPEMIPTVLTMALASAREFIPLPMVVEVFIMYVGFELIREAGIRIPSPIGTTIGIVGALLIGEAAVRASVVSPIMVILIAVTALASLTIPSQELQMSLRLGTPTFILVGAAFGLYGIVALTFMLLCYFMSLRSIGVPFFSPVSPTRPSAPDIVLRGPMWKMSLRPPFFRPKDSRRQPRVSRLWDRGQTLIREEPKNGDGRQD